MEELGIVNTEGGPLLLADFSIAQKWRGAEGDGLDYQRACALFDSNPNLEGGKITAASGQALLWEMGGPGTAAVFQLSKDHLVVVRVWPAKPTDDSLARIFAQLPTNRMVDLGQLAAPSGIVVIMWSVENGLCLQQADQYLRRPSKSTAVDNSVLICSTGSAVFRCQHDFLETARGSSRRLHLRRE
jgi:hypothetical protein